MWQKNKYLMFALMLVLLSGCHSKEVETTTLPFYTGPDFTPHWLPGDDPSRENLHSIAPFNFVNQNGEKVSESLFEGKIYVADFIFTTCPGICPKMSRNMLRLQKETAADEEILLLSHTVTPEIDTVPVLKKYADRQGAISGKWHLVTGERKAIYDIARKSYFADEDLGFQKDENDFLHSENFILVDKQRRIRGVYNGTLLAEMQRLLEDIKILKLEG